MSLDAETIKKLRELAERLPTGPWGWFGGETNMYLATKHSGRLYLMAFERRGMNGAQPVFRTGHTMKQAQDLAQFEVGDRSVVGFKEARKDSSVYRYDIRGFDNDVARWMAACSPDVILSLIDALDTQSSRTERAVAELDAMRKHYEDWHDIADPPQFPGRSLFEFYTPGTDDEKDPDTWFTATWDNKPILASHWCLIRTPIGPHFPAPPASSLREGETQ